jgi:uncharacterized membrane protein YkoI
MMHLRTFRIPVALSLLAFASTACLAYTGQQYAKDAKFDLVHARRIALQARPGIVTDQELERERGGSGLRYSFDIRFRGETFEVGIDARTGRVLQNSKEGRNPD